MLTLVRNDEGDWIGLYGHDGRLIEEGHSFDESRVLALAGIDHDVVYEVELGDGGSLPPTLGEITALPPVTKPYRRVRKAT